MVEVPSITYEVSIDEPLHPDVNVARRFREVALSDCEFGCKIHQDTISKVAVLAHSRIYGCRK